MKQTVQLNKNITLIAMVDVENVWLYLRKSRSNHIKLFKDFKEGTGSRSILNIIFSQ